MAEWWESPNPGGPMVGPRFIRPLYPPSAANRGKDASVPGLDIKGIKRGVSRSGHWPWIDDFNTTYTEEFATGRSGNVSDNGLAGLQRQNGIDATGWMGEATYNLIRSARIPDGLPHAGEPILDTTAIQLLNDYAFEFRGATPTVRQAGLAQALTYLGYKESPAGTNSNMFGAWYGMNYEPWCAMFITYCMEIGAEGGSPSFVRGSKYAYCPYVLADAKAKRNGLSLTLSPIAGDLVLFDWRFDGVPDHIGLYYKSLQGSSFKTVEGNTGITNNSNGGEVMIRERHTSDAKIHFVRVAEPV